ncbi:MAG: NADH-quinone oxidoreductase subunit M [Bacteroidia bacterium]|nr:NADH-quinone oxidoreductase subunit M [Bacteroidia bacterium]MCC6769423.1 NADH-quinone oxidoreductase subunit M [Bacteroidia bacterium]
MLSEQLTLLLLFFPLLAGLFVLIFPRLRSRDLAFAATLVQAALTGYVIWVFDIYQHSGLLANMQGVVEKAWIPTFGIRFFAGIDGISILMLILTNFLMPVIVLSTWNKEFKNPSLFYFLVLFMQTALVGVFTALDGFLYYIFWELALIPIYFIILLWGGENRVRITFKFFIYTLAGSLFMLVAMIWLFLQTGGQSFGIDAFYSLRLDDATQRWIFWAFMAAFAIKIPLMPFHSWQADTYTTAPNAGTMLLSAIMLKMGIYSIIRWVLPIMPDASAAYADVVMIMGLAGVIYGSWIAIGQNDLRRLFAWSSLAHVGLIAAGIFTLSRSGVQGALIQMLAHGVNVTALFFIAEILQQRVQTTRLDKLGGIRKLAPVFASVYLIISYASAALPLTNGFVGEFLLLASLYEHNYWYAAIGGLTIILCAAYMLRAYKFSMLGAPAEGQVFADLNFTEKLALFSLVGFVFLLGIFPQFIFNLSDEAVKFLIWHLNNYHGTP